MKLLFKQRFFSWFDSYDIYDEAGNVVFTVEGKLGWGHVLHILDRDGKHIAFSRFLNRSSRYTVARMNTSAA